MSKAIEIVQQEFDFYLMLHERLYYSDAYSKPMLNSMMKASSRRLRKMDDILFANAKEIDKAYDEIVRVFPEGMLPHEHPRRNQFNN